MNPNTIKLELDKTITKIVGYEYGMEIYENQAKNHIGKAREVYIEFPEFIDMVAPSFIQGFIVELLRIKGSKEELFDFLHFYSPNENVVKQIYDDLLMTM